MKQIFKRTSKQKEATALLALKMFSMLYGGSRSGKTFIVIRSVVIRALKTKSRHLIVRFRFNHVKTSIWYDTFPKVMSICFPDVAYVPNKADWFIEFPNGSQIWFGGIDDKERTEKILGNEYSTIYANECSQIGYEAVGVLATRLAEKSGLKMRFYFDCNPPTKTHWTYILFIEGKDPLTGEIKDPVQYGYLLMNPRDNTENLPEGYIENILAALPKRQRDRFELGLFLSDIEGALWTVDLLNKCIADYATYGELEKEVGIRSVVIGVDPSVSHKPDSDLAGIVVDALANDDNYYLIADASMKASPDVWATRVVDLYKYYKANAVIVEINQGGEMVKSILRSKGFMGKIVEVHASHSKFARAEPVVALYEQDRVKHLNNDSLRLLEDELTTYVPLQSKKSPDRLDAHVWAMSYFLDKGDTVAKYKGTNFGALARRAAQKGMK